MFASFLLTSIVCSVVTAIFLLRFLKQMLAITINQIISENLQSLWLKYAQLALLIVGVSNGVNISATKQLIEQRNLQSIPLDVFLMQVWSSVQGTAIAVILAVLVLFFVYVLLYYVNQLVPKK